MLALVMRLAGKRFLNGGVSDAVVISFYLNRDSDALPDCDYIYTLIAGRGGRFYVVSKKLKRSSR